MKIERVYFRGLMAALSCVALLLGSVVAVHSSHVQEKKDDATGAAVFKMPGGYMPADFAKFRGKLLLDPAKPAGMFVTYADDNEATEALRPRILAALAPMFLHDKEDKNATGFNWTSKPLPAHKGDGTGAATLWTTTEGTQEVQVAIYERAIGVRPFLYGYFAMRQTSGKGENGKFLDEQGNGVKAFDKFWQSFPGSK